MSKRGTYYVSWRRKERRQRAVARQRAAYESDSHKYEHWRNMLPANERGDK